MKKLSRVLFILLSFAFILGLVPVTEMTDNVEYYTPSEIPQYTEDEYYIPENSQCTSDAYLDDYSRYDDTDNSDNYTPEYEGDILQIEEVDNQPYYEEEEYYFIEAFGEYGIVALSGNMLTINIGDTYEFTNISNGIRLLTATQSNFAEFHYVRYLVNGDALTSFIPTRDPRIWLNPGERVIITRVTRELPSYGIYLECDIEIDTTGFDVIKLNRPAVFTYMLYPGKSQTFLNNSSYTASLRFDGYGTIQAIYETVSMWNAAGSLIFATENGAITVNDGVRIVGRSIHVPPGGRITFTNRSNLCDNIHWPFPPSRIGGCYLAFRLSEPGTGGVTGSGRKEVDFFSASANRNLRLTINWDDDWFRMAGGLNNDLAIASLVLSQDNLSTAKRTLNTLGFTGFESGNLLQVSYLFANKRIEIDGRDYIVVAVAVYGTTSPAGFASSFISRNPLGGVATYVGTYSGAAALLGQRLSAYVGGLGGSGGTGAGIKYWVTGHSRGGTVANLLSANVLTPAAGARNVFTYCFAAPNVTISTQTFHNIVNFDNTDDRVTQIVPLFLKYGSTWRFTPRDTAGFNESFRQLTGVNYARRFAHNLDTYLAYLLLNENVRTSVNRFGVKLVTIKCPVNVEIFNSSGALVGRIANYTIDLSVMSDEILLWFDGEDKNILLPTYTEYTIRMVGNDNGIMNITINYTDAFTWAIASEKDFNNVELYYGREMVLEVGGATNTPDIQLLLLSDGSAIGEILTDGTVVLFNNETPGAGGGGTSGATTTPGVATTSAIVDIPEAISQEQDISPVAENNINDVTPDNQTAPPLQVLEDTEDIVSAPITEVAPPVSGYVQERDSSFNIWLLIIILGALVGIVSTFAIIHFKRKNQEV